MNPARSLAPAIIAGFTANVWLYVVGLLAGAILAVGFARLLHGDRKASEQKAATGDGSA